MKRIFGMLVGAMMVTTMYAQVVRQNEAALVYYSPKTEVNLDFMVEVEIQEAGPYAEYAEELLGVTDFVAESQTTYRLMNVQIGTTTKADKNRAHKVSADAGIPMLLTINDKGILKGYNIPYAAPQPSKKHDMPKKEDCCRPLIVPPFSEDILKDSDSTDNAEVVAQQIYRIRETRTFLLSGEVEHTPADGASMKKVLEELDKQEHMLTELFVGKRFKHMDHRSFTIVPDTTEQLFFFSKELGFTDSDNIEADTIRVRMHLQAQTYAETTEEPVEEVTPKGKKGKTVTPAKPELSPIVYNLPGSADVQVIYADHVLGSKTIQVAQLGIDIPLPKDLFTGEQLPVIVFNEKTGNIVSISK